MCLLRQVKYRLRAKLLYLKVILTWCEENLSNGQLLFEISENLLERKPRRRTKFHMLDKMSFVHA